MEATPETIARVRLTPGKTLVQQLKEPDKVTTAGLVIAPQEGATANARNRFEAIVLAIGAMSWIDDRAVERHSTYDVGERVVVASYNPVDLWLEGQSFVIIDTDDVAAVIDRSAEEKSFERLQAAFEDATIEDEMAGEVTA